MTVFSFALSFHDKPSELMNFRKTLDSLGITDVLTLLPQNFQMRKQLLVQTSFRPDGVKSICSLSTSGVPGIMLSVAKEIELRCKSSKLENLKVSKCNKESQVLLDGRKRGM